LHFSPKKKIHTISLQERQKAETAKMREDRDRQKMMDELIMEEEKEVKKKNSKQKGGKKKKGGG
jgi:hypothetical protein